MVLKIIKSLIIGVISIFLVTIGIDAVDNYQNFSESLIGRMTGRGSSSVCPDDMVFVPTDGNGFCADKFEAAPDSDCPYNDPLNQEETRMNLNYQKCGAVSEIGKKPWRNISQNQAMMACAKAGKRLPNNREWFLTALGTPDSESAWQSDDCNVNKNWIDNPGLTGSANKCVSAVGAFDMIGNVWEWVDGLVTDGKISERVLPESGYVIGADADFIPVKTDKVKKDPNYYNDYFWIKNNGVRTMARGGYWGNGADAGQYAVYAVPDTAFASPGVGFRCVKSANVGK